MHPYSVSLAIISLSSISCLQSAWHCFMHITTDTAQVVIWEQIKNYFNYLILFNQAFICFTKQSDIYLAEIYLCTVNIGPVITFYM